MSVNVNGGALEFDAVINAQQFNAAISSIEKQLQGLTQTAQKEAGAIDGLMRKTATAIAAYATFAAGTNFVRDIVRVRGEFQQLEVAFTTMLGSKVEADKLMQQVTQFAAATPFELTEVAQATKQLLAFGFSADEVIGTLTTLGDVSAGLSQPVGEIAYLYGTIKTAGRATATDIRQFAQRGIPIYEELAKVLGTSKENIDNLVSAGKIGFPEVEKAFAGMTAEGSKFGGLMEAQSKTLTGQISNLSDAWDQMLNTIGKGQEGLFSDIILGATEALKNFDKVVDILKILVITYGSYRAAIIATTVVQAIATSATKGYTVAETLRYQAMLLSERAMKLLNKTALVNPWVALATGVALLVSALVIFTKRGSEAQRIQKALNEVQNEAAKSVAAEKDVLQSLLKVAKDETKSKEDRLAAINKIIAISPEHLGTLTLENLKTKEGTELIQAYIKALDQKALAQAVSAKKQKIFEENIDLQSAIDAAKQAGAGESSSALSNLFGPSKQTALNLFLAEKTGQLTENLKLVDALNTTYEKQLTSELIGEGQKQTVKGRTIAVIQEEIKAQQDLQKQATDKKGFSDYQKNIDKLNRELEAITGKAASKTALKAGNDFQSALNQRLEALKNLLKDIADAETQARTSGLRKEELEIEKINKRYDELKAKATQLKANGAVFNRIEVARNTELFNNDQRGSATEYKKMLDQQKELFDQFEKYKLSVGQNKAEELTNYATGYYENFIDFLKQQLAALANDNSLSGQLKKQTLATALNGAEKDQTNKEVEDQAKRFEQLISATISFRQQRESINKKYDALEADLEKNKSLPGFKQTYEERKAILKNSRDEELKDLSISAARQSDVYKKLNEDIILYTREQLKQRSADLKKILEKDATLTPQMKADLQSYIEQLDNLIKSSGSAAKTAKDFANLSSDFSSLSGIFSDAAGAVDGLNEGLADTLSTLAELTGVASSAFNAISQFASGNIIGGIASAVKAIASIFSLGKKSRESQRKAEEEIANFQARVMAGEIEINQTLRERQRDQVKLNKLKVQGLLDEKKLLLEQRNLVLQQYNSILSQLQQQSAVVGEASKKYGGFLGIGRKTKVVEITQSLAGKTFDELEKLFATGQLTGKAKELFEQLQKIKQEGIDIDQLLQENAAQAQQLFTGTTADNIVDTIANGFASGLHSAADFASSFEDLMKTAIINSLKFKALEEPLKQFFAEFAQASQSDGQLTASEIDALKNLYGSIIDNANAQFQQLQQISGINFNGAGGSGSANNLTGAIKGMTEQQAELLAGQFGGLRITALEHLSVGRKQLDTLNNIQAHTGATVIELKNVIDKMIYYYETKGVKVI